MRLAFYDLIKPLKRFEMIVMALSMGLYIGVLLIFSSLFDFETERLLNGYSNRIYYMTQSAYMMWIVLGSAIVVRSHTITPKIELYLAVSLKSAYIYAKAISYYIYVFLLCFYIYGIYQIIYMAAFGLYIGFEETFFLLMVNGFVFASFMLLWIRIQSKYTMLFGFLIVILLPTVDISTISFIKTLLPYLAVLKRQSVYASISIGIIYVIVGVELQKLLKK